MQVLLITILFGWIIGLSAPRALAASQVTYELLARVNGQDANQVCPPTGKTMPIELTVTRGLPLNPVQNNTEKYIGSSDPGAIEPVVSATINNGSTINFNAYDELDVYRNDQGVYGYTITGFNQSTGLVLEVSQGSASSVPNYRVPFAIKPKEFGALSFIYYIGNSQCTGTIIGRLPPSRKN